MNFVDCVRIDAAACWASFRVGEHDIDIVSGKREDDNHFCIGT